MLARVYQYAFLAGPCVFFRPYHLTRPALIRDFLSYGFPMKLRAGPYHVMIEIIVLLDFNSTKQGLPLVDFSHVASTEIKCILIVISLPHSGYNST